MSKNNFSCCSKSKISREANSPNKFLKVFVEENCLKIFCLLKKGPLCVCEISQCLKLPQNLTSHHLKVLKDFGLVSSYRKGLKIFYQLKYKTVEKYLKLLNKYLLH
jgi:ArsR family transcriptional regulator